MFKGTLTALITPFNRGSIDIPAFENLVRWQIESGIHGLVPCGSTGESLFLSHEEHKDLVARTVSISSGQVPVLAGSGAVTTAETIELTKNVKEAGADGALIVTPAYVKPGPEAMYQHFKAVTEAVDIPIIIYNNPGRTGSAMDQETLARLAQLPNIIGVKDSTSDMTRPTLTNIALGDKFLQFSGEDPTVFGFLAQGGMGWISVISNIAPTMCAEICNAWERQDMETFATIRNKLMPLMKALFCESNPVPVKCAASILGLCQNEMRRPLTEASAQTETLLRTLIGQIGITLTMKAGRG